MPYKSLLVLSCILLFVFFSGWTSSSDRKSGGAPVSKTNAPGEPNCTTSGCHSSNAVNSGSGSMTVELVGGDTTYVPGANHTLRITIDHSGFDKFGFQSVILNDLDSNIGSIQLTDAIRTQVISPSSQPYMDRKYITHTFDGNVALNPGQTQWEFTWTAPDNASEPITIYTCALAANNDLVENGDYTYCEPLTLTKDPAADMDDQKITQAISIYPNPVRDVLYVTSHKRLLKNNVTLNLYDLKGTLVLRKHMEGKKMNISHLDLEGVYLYTLLSNDNLLKQGRLIITN